MYQQMIGMTRGDNTAVIPPTLIEWGKEKNLTPSIKFTKFIVATQVEEVLSGKGYLLMGPTCMMFSSEEVSEELSASEDWRSMMPVSSSPLGRGRKQ